MGELVISLDSIQEEDRGRCGGKATSLGSLVQRGFRVPLGLCVTTDAYREFLRRTPIKGKMTLELSRKIFEEMRWEEMWDLSLRMKTLFLNTALPGDLEKALLQKLNTLEADPVVVRSSSLAEDSSSTSFAGVHDSFVNVKGTSKIMDHLRMVWASLWSDRAFLYRRELGLDLESSAMAVLVQKMVKGERSGVIFSRDPDDENLAMVEAVPGMNQGMVDGTVPPDRWTINRSSGEIVSFTPSSRDKMAVPASEGIEYRNIGDEGAVNMSDEDVKEVFQRAYSIERLFRAPQDIEFTFDDHELFILQSRPITTITEDGQRAWYRTLRRSFDNLIALKEKIESEILPSMIDESRKLESIDLAIMSDEELAGEIEKRKAILDSWEGVYKDNLIPFAHGMRLFGEVYNATMKPKDPHQFLEVLASDDMLSIQRNKALVGIAKRAAQDEELLKQIRYGGVEDSSLREEMELIVKNMGGRLRGSSSTIEGLGRIIVQMVEIGDLDREERIRAEELENQFLAEFSGNEVERAKKLLDLGRTSYRLRDDDNLLLGRIEGELERSRAEGISRIADKSPDLKSIPLTSIIDLLRNPEMELEFNKEKVESEQHLKSRQLVGQPAIKGIATGRARVVIDEEQLFDFKRGEVLVCDSLDPNMTFVAPLCSAIVERRGGMLIHGAIIAREYGIPCVTGIPDATEVIETGDKVTVDGFLGIVTVDRMK
jgi:phosphoenolpyruvate synthase/pyruvate phosphate dikinase